MSLKKIETTDERAEELAEVVAKRFIELAKTKELQGRVDETVLQTIILLKEEKVVNEEESLVLATLWEEIAGQIVELAYKENPDHDCKKCIIEYLCKPEEKAKKLLSAMMGHDLGDSTMISGKGGEA